MYYLIRLSKTEYTVLFIIINKIFTISNFLSLMSYFKLDLIWWADLIECSPPGPFSLCDLCLESLNPIRYYAVVVHPSIYCRSDPLFSAPHSSISWKVVRPGPARRIWPNHLNRQWYIHWFWNFCWLWLYIYNFQGWGWGGGVHHI